MKTEILRVLRERGTYVSGQELCSLLSVSRTAIWKKIKQLEEEGYEIEAVPNRGYRLLAVPDTIAAQEVESHLTTAWIAHPIIYFDQISSTNQYAKKIAEEGAAEGTLIVADEQTQGKGRFGRSWKSPHGTAIAMTLLLRPKLPPDRMSMITLVQGLAVAEAVRELYDLDARIKWPNDVVVNGKKLCGILTEMSTDLHQVAYLVIGTGINANVPSFPEELNDKAISLRQLLGREIGRAPLIACVMKWFENDYETFLQTQDLRSLKDRYEALLVNRGAQVRVLQPGGEYTGKALGIDPMGQLLVETDDGSIQEVYAGEVSVRGVYGYV